MRGFDFNGVIDTERFTIESGDSIVTGNTINMSEPVLTWLTKHGISCPVFFNPDIKQAYDREAAGKWKASILAKSEVNDFYEDDPIQAAIIRNECPNLTVVFV